MGLLRDKRETDIGIVIQTTKMLSSNRVYAERRKKYSQGGARDAKVTAAAPLEEIILMLFRWSSALQWNALDAAHIYRLYLYKHVISGRTNIHTPSLTHRHRGMRGKATCELYI